ncbi:MAG: hypothetical protein A3D93_01920 [Acidobacteria bacterium RIFCSPHIGHO2_12_FULL_67_30]|nr:MAG: hypothetical protein A3D93_01920 [Acidobacteria bacterium RIFCSPHIGHO2_12_FULL_67_30]
MEREEDTVRVWVGLNFLQAEMMKQMLLENGIACFGDRDPGVLPFGEFGEIGLWVSKQDGPRARQLLEEVEDAMSAELDEESSDDKEKA